MRLKKAKKALRELLSVLADIATLIGLILILIDRIASQNEQEPKGLALNKNSMLE